MKNKDVYKLRKILEKWINKKGKFSYAIIKNIEMLDTLINTFNRFKVIDKTDYELQKKIICMKYSNNIENNKYIINNKKDFNREMDDLDYNFLKTTEILNSKLNIKFYKIKKDHLPNNLSANDLKEISFMLE